MEWSDHLADAVRTFPAVAQEGPRPAAVSNLLLEMIRDGRCRAGQRLPNERKLARTLGVSRSSLRESVRALAMRNVLDVRHGSGTYVTSLDPQLLAEPLQLILAIDPSALFSLFEMRRILEPAIASLAARRADRAALARLWEEMRAGEAAAEDAPGLVAHDTRLHRLIHECARNPLALSTSASLAGLAHQVRLWTVTFPANSALTLREHAAIVAAITARQAKTAETAMRRHLMRIERQLRNAVAAGASPMPGPLEMASKTGSSTGGKQ